MRNKPFASNALVIAATLVALSGTPPRAVVAQSAAHPVSATTPGIAQIGIEIPTLGGADWGTIQRHYVTPAIMAEIRDDLHASYVRTGWIPGRLRFEIIRWYREDNGMDIICGSGLHVMIILPSPPRNGSESESDRVDSVREFFARYTAREPGCIRYAEVANEADLPRNRFAGVQDYAAYYRDVAPIVASFGIPVITTGVSGEDVDWTSELANLLYAWKSPVSGYGFHPYGVAPSRMADATLAIRRAAGTLPNGSLPSVYVTEIGESEPRALYDTIVNLARATPVITIYEYKAQANEDPRYGLKDNPALYAAVQQAWQTLHPAQSATSSQR